MDNVNKLNAELLKQPFMEGQKLQEQLDKYRNIASAYAQIENAIAVLSDMKADMSYIYYGGISGSLGLVKRDSTQVIHSIWEKDIINRIHPEDMAEKFLDELRFYHFIKGVPKQKRTDYYLISNIRMRDVSGKYIYVQHRMFYLSYDSNDCTRLALCLYNLSTSTSLERLIVNSVTGLILKQEKQVCDDILSDREKIVLRLIEEGKMSKDISRILSISINTVSRHRQNILEKLQVNNSIEACKVAKKLKLL